MSNVKIAFCTEPRIAEELAWVYGILSNDLVALANSQENLDWLIDEILLMQNRRPDQKEMVNHLRDKLDGVESRWT